MVDKVLTLKFADSPLPEFKKAPGKSHIPFGVDDKYPDYLLYLYNKSPKHNAIINGKAHYIFGGGLKASEETPEGEKFLKAVNHAGESLDDLSKKSIHDIELNGGFYWQVIFNRAGGVEELYHLPYSKMRQNADGTEFFYKKNWQDTREKAQVFPLFNINHPCNSVYFFGEYRPGVNIYSTPSYVGSINYIESDIEVSKHTLTNAKAGFSATKFLNFYDGPPEDADKAREIDRKFNKDFSGSDGKRVMIGYNKDPLKRPTIDDLGTSDLTKEDFAHVDNLISQNIYAGHQITSPALFGIKTEGQLGGTTELRTAYDIFKNTYVKNKQQQLERIINQFAKVKGIKVEYSFLPSDPIGFEFSEATLLQAAPRSWLLEKMGIDPVRYPDAPAQAKPTDAKPVTVETESDKPAVNDNLKNMTPVQYRHLTRITREYAKGILTQQAAVLILINSFNISEEEAKTLLGIEETEQLSKEYTEEEVADMFSEVGEGREVFTVVKSKEVFFATDADCLKSELEFFQEHALAFAEAEKKKEGIIDRIRKTLPKIEVKYSYEPREGLTPIIATTRPFCKKLIELDRLYSRQDIEKISERLGYSVWDRRGGFWGSKKACRHIWKSNIVIKKS